MKSPLKSPTIETKALGTLKKLIPNGSIVHSFLLYDGQVEIELSKTKRFIVSHTNRYVNYEFWQCLMRDPLRVSEVARHFYPVSDKNSFEVLQKNWLKFPDPYVRTGFFLLLNRASDMGYVSHGALIEDDSTKKTIDDLSRFVTQNFHVAFDKEDNFIDSVRNIDTQCDYIFLPIGKFSLNIFEEGKSEGFEQTKVIHKEVRDFIDNTDKKVILLYKYSKAVTDFYKDSNVYIIDQWGRNTDATTFAKEVLIANF